MIDRIRAISDMPQRLRLTLSAEQLDLLDDVLAYYVLAGMGGGDRDTPEDHAMIDDLQRRIAEGRERLDR